MCKRIVTVWRQKTGGEEKRGQNPKTRYLVIYDRRVFFPRTVSAIANANAIRTQEQHRYGFRFAFSAAILAGLVKNVAETPGLRVRHGSDEGDVKHVAVLLSKRRAFANVRYTRPEQDITTYLFSICPLPLLTR